VFPLDIAMFVGLSNMDDQGHKDAFIAGFVGRNLAPAVVHLAHGRPGLAFGSVGLHAAATATGVAIGYAIGIAIQKPCAPGGTCNYGVREMPPGPGYGAVAGSMVGTVLDVIFLANRPRSTWAATQTGLLTVAPFATGSSGGMAAAGTF
jgi:hypothetical protein